MQFWGNPRKVKTKSEGIRGRPSGCQFLDRLLGQSLFKLWSYHIIIVCVLIVTTLDLPHSLIIPTPFTCQIQSPMKKKVKSLSYN